MSKTINRAPIIGFVRYSQKILFGNKERNMFEPEYFEYRFRIFKNVTLKSFQQQTDQKFILLLLHSESMPAHYKKLFYELESENSFLYNVFVSDNAEAFSTALKDSKKYAEFENGVAVTFRIDNDDAVQNDFIEKLYSYLKTDFAGFAICIPNTLIIKPIEDKMYLLQDHYYPGNAVGLSYVTKGVRYKTVMEIGQHHLINHKIPLILLPSSSSSSLITINGENAANQIHYDKSTLFTDEQLKLYLSMRSIGNMDFSGLKICGKREENDRFSFRRILELIIPPIMILGIRKAMSFAKKI